ncbi:carbohydrate ABC transporter permease [Sulfobacillus harzensis]|uniref:Sugar ABC transporter permease n=1 Tax=Sulfobacillus harzensis TaxID=2729629 RepID=A0A7Y0L4Q0_9FIRM|nr:sugar ABC transporter permease [Sulfobacillus harzensis]NMP23185.1 sugar ABC transporter permease [Sulfobacillus harzensis]
MNQPALTEPTAAAVHAQPTRPRKSKDLGKAILFLLPMFAFLIVFTYLPAGVALVLGFFHYHLLGVDTTFGGLADFKEALTYAVFWQALRNTLVYALYMIPATIVGAVAIAVLISEKSRFYAVLRTFVLLPYITPVIATSIGWLWMFNPQYGILNAVLHWLHLPESQWLLSPRMAMPSIALYSLWHGLGFDVIIVLSALANIPQQVLEAAAIDGATGWTRFRRVTLPLLSPTLFFLVIITTIGTLQAFSQIFALTSSPGSPVGGPQNATLTLIILIYQTAFSYFHLSYGSAMALLLVIIILGLTLVQNWLSKKWVFYQ